MVIENIKVGTIREIVQYYKSLGISKHGDHSAAFVEHQNGSVTCLHGKHLNTSITDQIINIYNKCERIGSVIYCENIFGAPYSKTDFVFITYNPEDDEAYFKEVFRKWFTNFHRKLGNTKSDVVVEKLVLDDVTNNRLVYYNYIDNLGIRIRAYTGLGLSGILIKNHG